MSSKDVLIIDDNQDIREGFALILEDEGYKVHLAENGLVALNFLRNLHPKIPGCIILDLMMPVMDGKTFLETLNREHPDDLCKIPIIVATAFRSSDHSVDELPCQLDQISKPTDIDQLLETVHKHCH